MKSDLVAIVLIFCILLLIAVVCGACTTAQPKCTWQKIDPFSNVEFCRPPRGNK